MTIYKRRPRFPAPALPDEPADRKLLGVYEQRQEGMLLQRIRIPGGRLSRAQWLAIADAAEKVGARPALHLTTRQCVEVHGLTEQTVPVLQRLLADAGLSTVGAAGDTLRTITVDPEAGLVPGTWDLMPLAHAIVTAVEEQPGIWELPRKFKISLSGSDSARMRPWMSDIGLIAAPDGSLSAVIAGSLGPNPATGLLYREGLTPAETTALAVAAVRLHSLEGDRANRRKARLRHVRERMGDAAFVARVDALFDEEKAKTRPAVALRAAADARDHGELLRLSVPHGDLSIQALREIVEALDPVTTEMRIGIEHDIHIAGCALGDLPEQVARWAHRGRIVSCPGTALCPKAVVSTHDAESALLEHANHFSDKLIAISGCPNSCAHAPIADVGLIGRKARMESGERVDAFDVYAGGDGGSGPGLATLRAKAVPTGDLEGVVGEILAHDV